LSFKRI
ncbi:hrpJ-like domain protein, partial [Vibrio parahaemolyticus 861]